jgi:iron complex outermembrane receptor protein
MGGVMNIITRNAPLEPKTTIRMKVGGYSQPRYSQWKWRDSPGYFHAVEITHGRTFSTHNGWIRMQRFSTDGYSQLDWEDAYNLTGKIKLNINSKLNASFYGNYYTEEVGLASQWKSSADPFVAPPGDENDHAKGYKFHANGSMNIIIAPDLIIKSKSGYYDVKWHNYGRTNRDNSREKKGFTEIQISKNLSNISNLSSGLSFQIADINARLFGKHSSQSYAGYILFQQKLWTSLSVSLNGRMEYFLVDNEALDQTFAPQFALNWNPTELMALRASIGKGFRVPTIAELYTRSQLNIFRVEPNPDLRSETSLAYELGGTLKSPKYGPFSNLTLEGALFRTHFKNLIEPLPDVNGIIHFENITNAIITGTELSLNTGIFSELFRLSVSYTWLDPVQVNSSGSVVDTLSYRYRHQLVSTLSFRWGVVNGGVEYRNASRIEKVELFQENLFTEADKRVPIHVWNVFLGVRMNQWEAIFRLDNIFQYYYVELERNLGEERNFSFTLSKTF